MPRGRGRGGSSERGKTKAKTPPVRIDTPPPHDSSSGDDSQDPTDQVERSSQKGSPVRKRKKAQPLNLTREQEVSVIEWLKDHPELFDKSDSSYKDSVKKKALWNAIHKLQSLSKSE